MRRDAMSVFRQALPHATCHSGRMHEDFDRCYRAVQSKDARFDGWFVTAVLTTQDLLPPELPGAARR